MRLFAALALVATAAAVHDCIECKTASSGDGFTNDQIVIMHPEYAKFGKFTSHQCFVMPDSTGFPRQCVCRCSNSNGVYTGSAEVQCGASHGSCTRCELPINSGPECTSCVVGQFVHEKTCIPTPKCEENPSITAKFTLAEGSHSGCENRGGKLVNKHGMDWTNAKTRYNQGDDSWNNEEDNDTCVFTSAIKPLSYPSGQPFHGFKSIKMQFVLEDPYENLESDETSTVEIRTCTSTDDSSCSSWAIAHDAQTATGTYTATVGTNQLDSIGAKVWVGGELETEHHYEGLEFEHAYVQARVTLSLANTKEVSRKITTNIHECQVESHWTSKYDTRGGCRASHCCATRRCGRSGRSRCCTRNCCHAWHQNTHTVRHEDKPGNLPGNHYGLQMHTKKGECSNAIDKKVFEVEEQAFHSLKVWGSC
jgi:hypothetical protein